jgi:hypothetical protein
MQKEIIWLKARKQELKIFSIAKQIGMNSSTLKKFLDGIRPLPAEWEKPVIEWVREFKRQPDEALLKPKKKKK